MTTPRRFIQRMHREARVCALKVRLFRMLTPPEQKHYRCQAEPDCKGRNLQVHHLDGRSWRVEAVNEETRWKRYVAEAEKGVRLALWCAKHNGRDGRARRGR